MYNCKKITEDIKIDGNIDKKVWQRAQKITLVDTVTAVETRQKTSVRMLWNDKSIFVAFLCKDSYINATMTGYNDPLYNEEVVEVFINCNNDKNTYIEIEVNPLNAVLHYLVFNNLKGNKLLYARVNKVIKSAVLRQGERKYWSVEIEIPFSELIMGENNPPKAGDELHMNSYRIDRPKDGRDEYSAWSPTGEVDFHMPQCFGKMIFIE